MKSKYPNSVVKVDFASKFAGEALFSDDIPFKDALFAKTLRSTVAAGKIKSIKLPNFQKVIIGSIDMM